MLKTTDNPQDAKALYLARVEALYAQVEGWCRAEDPPWLTTRGEVEIYEQPVGKYVAPTLEVEMGSGVLVTFLPRAFNVFGGEGRIDMVGRFATEALFYMAEDGPFVPITMLTAQGNLLAEPGEVAARGVEEGWVLLQNHRLGLYPVFDRTLFVRLAKALSE